MTQHRIVVAALCMALGACTASQSPVPPAPQSETAAPSSTPAPASEALTAKRAPGQEHVDPLQVFRALGTEPFWSVNVEGDKLTFITPEDQVGVVMQGQRRAMADGVEITGRHESKAFALSVRAGACSDGMSDNQYLMTASFHFGDAVYTGCGEAAQ